MAYEFVEAFSSVFPRIRISQILAAAGIIVDVAWRIAARNFFGPLYIDIIAGVLFGYYLGKRPRGGSSEQGKKSKWTRLS